MIRWHQIIVKRILIIFCVLSFLKSSVLPFSLYIMITFTDPSWKISERKDKSQIKTLGNLRLTKFAYLKNNLIRLRSMLSRSIPFAANLSISLSKNSKLVGRYKEMSDVING